jgi:hypothetical protein
VKNCNANAGARARPDALIADAPRLLEAAYRSHAG